MHIKCIDRLPEETPWIQRILVGFFSLFRFDGRSSFVSSVAFLYHFHIFYRMHFVNLLLRFAYLHSRFSHRNEFNEGMTEQVKNGLLYDHKPKFPFSRTFACVISKTNNGLDFVWMQFFCLFHEWKRVIRHAILELSEYFFFRWDHRSIPLEVQLKIILQGISEKPINPLFTRRRHKFSFIVSYLVFLVPHYLSKQHRIHF